MKFIILCASLFLAQAAPVKEGAGNAEEPKTTTTAPLPPIGFLDVNFDKVGANFANPDDTANGWLFANNNLPTTKAPKDAFMNLRNQNSGHSEPIVARQNLIGGYHDVTNQKPKPKPQLLGTDGGASNPFADEFKPPTTTQNLLGVDHGVRNPFAADFQPPTANEIAEAHGDFLNEDFDAFFRNMQRMHEHMNKMIRDELNDNTFDQMGPGPMMMTVGKPQIYLEVEKFDGENPPEKHVWTNIPGLRDDESKESNEIASSQVLHNLDERENFVQASRPFYIHPKDDEYEYQAQSASIMSCLRRRLAHLTHTARVMFFITVFLIFATLGLALIYLCKRVHQKRRPTIYVPPSPSRMSIASIEKPPVYTTTDANPITEKPPGYQAPTNVDNPNYQEEQKEVKDEKDIKIVA